MMLISILSTEISVTGCGNVLNMTIFMNNLTQKVPCVLSSNFCIIWVCDYMKITESEFVSQFFKKGFIFGLSLFFVLVLCLIIEYIREL